MKYSDIILIVLFFFYLIEFIAAMLVNGDWVYIALTGVIFLMIYKLVRIGEKNE